MTDYLARAGNVGIRHLHSGDLNRLSAFAFTVSIVEPLTEKSRIAEGFAATGFWTEEAGAIGIIDLGSDRLIGTSQFYRSAPCIHGLELGYILHDPADRGRGFGRQAVRLFSDLLFKNRPAFHRHQLLIEVWNTSSIRLAERCGFIREGMLRNAGFNPTEPADCFVYSRTRKDWFEELHTKVGV